MPTVSSVPSPVIVERGCPDRSCDSAHGGAGAEREKDSEQAQPDHGATSILSERRASARRDAARSRAAPSRHAAARRRRDGRAHERDPLVERQLARDQPRRARCVTGASTPARSSARASSGTDSSASTAWPIARRDLGRRDALGEQLAGAAVAALRRQRGGDEVAGARPGRSSTPAARPARSAKRQTSAKMWPGGGAGGVEALAPRSRRRRARRRSWPRPRARRRPGRWTARRRRPARMKTPRERRARARSSVEAATSPAPSVTISRACAGPPMQATRSAPKRSREQRRSARCRRAARGPWPARRPRARAAEPAPRQPGDHLVEPARRDAEEDVVGAARARRRPARSAARAAARRPGR